MVAKYLELVAAAMNTPSSTNINAVENFETNHPEVIDLAYQEWRADNREIGYDAANHCLTK